MPYLKTRAWKTVLCDALSFKFNDCWDRLPEVFEAHSAVSKKANRWSCDVVVLGLFRMFWESLTNNPSQEVLLQTGWNKAMTLGFSFNSPLGWGSKEDSSELRLFCQRHAVHSRSLFSRTSYSAAEFVDGLKKEGEFFQGHVETPERSHSS